jgi:hypothetical protein
MRIDYLLQARSPQCALPHTKERAIANAGSAQTTAGMSLGLRRDKRIMRRRLRRVSRKSSRRVSAPKRAPNVSPFTNPFSAPGAAIESTETVMGSIQCDLLLDSARERSACELGAECNPICIMRVTNGWETAVH